MPLFYFRMLEKKTLYIVATPIGNLEDISARALRILKEADVVVVEDTRRSQRLLQHFDIQRSLFVLHDHNESEQTQKILEMLQKGASVALISDAGTPLISDPGYELVRASHQAGVQVVPIPGPCAFIAALSAAGLPSDRFVFEGFLPVKEKARVEYLQMLVHESRTMIFYEAPHRILATLKDAITVFGEDREAAMARELTKVFETIRLEKLGELLQWVEADDSQQQGEIVLLIRGITKEKQSVSDETLHVLKVLLKTMSVRQASQLASEITGVKKNLLYEIALTVTKDSSNA